MTYSRKVLYEAFNVSNISDALLRSRPYIIEQNFNEYAVKTIRKIKHDDLPLGNLILNSSCLIFISGNKIFLEFVDEADATLVKLTYF